MTDKMFNALSYASLILIDCNRSLNVVNVSKILTAADYRIDSETVHDYVSALQHVNLHELLRGWSDVDAETVQIQIAEPEDNIQIDQDVIAHHVNAENVQIAEPEDNIQNDEDLPLVDVQIELFDDVFDEENDMVLRGGPANPHHRHIEHDFEIDEGYCSETEYFRPGLRNFVFDFDFENMI